MTAPISELDDARVRKAREGAFVRGDHAELADRLLVLLSSRRDWLVSDGGDVCRYEPSSGTWEVIEHEELVRTVKIFAGSPKSKDGKPNGVINITSSSALGSTMLATAELHRRDAFANAPPGVVFTNGFVRVVDGAISLSANAPENMARARLEFPYDPAAKHQELDDFFGSLFGDCSEEECAARTMLIQEYLGACLLGMAPSYQKCLVFQGGGGNGKSAVEEVCRSVFPRRLVCSLPPQHWDERFQLSRLVGCLANIVDEIPQREIVAGETFKSVVTGEPQHAERKHRDPFEFRPRAGHIFSCNILPPSADLTDGFFRRFLVIPLTRKFDTAADRKRDIGKLVVAACLPGIAAWALAGGARLQRQGEYTIPSSSDELVANWRRSADSVALFVEERCSRNEQGTMASSVYGSYKGWCGDSGYKHVSSKTFAHRLEACGVFSVRRTAGVFYPLDVALKS